MCCPPRCPPGCAVSRVRGVPSLPRPSAPRARGAPPCGRRSPDRRRRSACASQALACLCASAIRRRNTLASAVPESRAPKGGIFAEYRGSRARRWRMPWPRAPSAPRSCATRSSRTSRDFARRSRRCSGAPLAAARRRSRWRCCVRFVRGCSPRPAMALAPDLGSGSSARLLARAPHRAPSRPQTDRAQLTRDAFQITGINGGTIGSPPAQSDMASFARAVRRSPCHEAGRGAAAPWSALAYVSVALVVRKMQAMTSTDSTAFRFAARSRRRMRRGTTLRSSRLR